MCSNSYNKIIDTIIVELRRRQHEFINYKNAMRGIIEVLEPNEIKNELIKYMNEESKEHSQINNLIYINNPVIKAIIYKFICKIESSNINFNYQIENDVVDDILNYIEITNILSNLLNNSFEEVIRDGCIDKYIDIKIFNYLDEHHITIVNSIVQNSIIDINKIFKKGYSSKQSSNHGYGLYNIKKLIDLHKGNIKIELNNNEFKIDIYFNSSGKSGSP
ncbi:MAG TPA: hypothetical protein DG753_03880 [Clostridium sp.]|nr:hypothetical protein [Clostridium sp.]